MSDSTYSMPKAEHSGADSSPSTTPHYVLDPRWPHRAIPTDALAGRSAAGKQRRDGADRRIVRSTTCAKD
jgi:hypothetical protein